MIKVSQLKEIQNESKNWMTKWSVLGADGKLYMKLSYSWLSGFKEMFEIVKI